MKNTYLTKNILPIEDLNIPEEAQEILNNKSKQFSDWLVNRIKEGKGTQFEVEDLPIEISQKLNQFKNLKFSQQNMNLKLSEDNNKGYITTKDINKFEHEKERILFNHKLLYDSPLEAIKILKSYQTIYSVQDSIIKFKIILNLDFDRQDHKIQSLLELPNKSKLTSEVCVVTSEDNINRSINFGAKEAISAAKLASNLEEGKFAFKKIICTENELKDILDYCKENLEANAIEVPTRENGTCVANSEDLETALKFITGGFANLRAIEKVDEKIFKWINLNEGKLKMIEVEIGDTQMSEEDLQKNAEAVINKINEMKPKSIEGRYILSGVMSVNNKLFAISSESLNKKNK